MTRFFTFLLMCILFLFFGSPEVWGQCGSREFYCENQYDYDFGDMQSKPEISAFQAIFYVDVSSVDEVTISVNPDYSIREIGIYTDCIETTLAFSEVTESNSYQFSNINVSNIEEIQILIRYDICLGLECGVYGGSVSIECEESEPLKEICDDPVTLRCGRSHTATTASHSLINSEIRCPSSSPFWPPVPSGEGTSYRVNTADQDILKVQVDRVGGAAKRVYVLSSCAGTLLACGDTESGTYISGEIDVSGYNNVYIFVEYLCPLVNCNSPEHRIQVTCEERDPTENCEDLSPYCHDNFKIYPSLSDPGSYTIEYDLPDNIGAEPYSWTVNGTTVEDDGASLERNFQGGRSHDICFQYLHEEYEFGSGTCSMCCMEFCPPENLLDCDVIEVVDRGGGLNAVAVPEEKNGQEIHIINWYAHRANGSIIYEFQEGERDTWNAGGFPPTAMTQGEQPVYFTLAYRLGNDTCIRVCCICYDPRTSYDGSVVPIPLDYGSDFFKLESIDPSVELIDFTVYTGNENENPIAAAGELILRPNTTYEICALIKDGNCYRWMCFDFCVDDYESCGRIALEGTSEGNLTYGFTGTETPLTWFTADGSNRTVQNGAKGVVPDSYARGDGKIYCLYRDSENGCVRLCCYDGRCTPYTPESFNDYRGEVDCEAYPMALPFVVTQGDCGSESCELNLDASSSMGSNLQYRWVIYYENGETIGSRDDVPQIAQPTIQDYGGIIGIELQVSNSCGSSTVYISCSDFYNRCLTFEDIGPSFFDISETEPLKVDFSSDFAFGVGSQYEIEFGDGTSESYNGSSLGTVTHGYDRPGVYYVCVKVRYYCDVEEETPTLRSGSTTSRNCCEIILCKYIKVGCTETWYDCDIIEYGNIVMEAEALTMDLSAAPGFGGGKWFIDGEESNGRRETFAYGRDYHCCYEYINAYGCLIRCCRKIRFEPEDCGLIRPEFTHFRSDNGRPTFNFSLNDGRFTPLAWTVSGTSGSTKHGDIINYGFRPRSNNYEICVLYNDEEGCLRVCCFCLNIPPDHCEDSPPVTFQYEPSVESEGISYRFEMTEEGVEPVEWYLTDENDERIGIFSDPLITCPPAHTGKRLKVCVLYRSGNCYYYRCIPVVFENPELCELLEETDVAETGETRVSYSGFDDILDSYWVLNGERVEESEGELSVDLCCLDPYNKNILCFYYKVDYGEYCTWKLCCIELEGEGCPVIEPPIIEDLYFDQDVVFIKARRTNQSAKSGLRVVLPCDVSDTIYLLKNLETGEVTTHTSIHTISLPSSGNYELCYEIYCLDDTKVLSERSCINLKGGLPGSCEIKPMAMPFTWTQVGDNCTQGVPQMCRYEFDAALSMGDDLTYSWSVYYADSSGYIAGTESFSSEDPVVEKSLPAGFNSVKLTVSNSCGTSTFYMACTDWTNSCINFSNATQDFFSVNVPDDNDGLTIDLSSDYAFPADARIQIDFGDNNVRSLEDPSELRNLSHTYQKAGIYYVCLKIRLQCAEGHEELSDSTPSCCEIILCKFIKVGCVKSLYPCDTQAYVVEDIREDGLLISLHTEEGFEYEEGSWTMNGKYVNPDSVVVEYGKSYLCCVSYIDSDGCLVECCRKIQIDPPFECDVIQPEFQGMDGNGGYLFGFALTTEFESIEAWGVRGGGFEDLGFNDNLGTFNFPPREEPYEICVIYYDAEGCLKICCYCLYVDPEYCPEVIPYEFISSGSQGLTYSFDLDIGEEAEAVSWMLKNGSGETLDESSDNILVCPEPETGNPLEVCVLYRIGNCYYFKCMPVVCRNPIDCDLLTVTETEQNNPATDGELTYEISFTGDIQIDDSYWTVNGERFTEGNSPYTLNFCCPEPGRNEICYFYKIGCIWYMCCTEINPYPCNEHFDCDRWFRPLSTDDPEVLSYTYDNDFVEVSKIEVNGELISENERELHLPVGEYDGPIEICYYIIGPGGCIYVCCKTIDPSCECPPDVDPLYCENFNDDVGEEIGMAEPDWWTGDALVEVSQGESCLELSSGDAYLDLKDKKYNYLSVELELGNCDASMYFDPNTNYPDDDGEIYFPNNSGGLGCFIRTPLAGFCELFSFDVNKTVVVELVGEDIKSLRVNGSEIGKIPAPEIIRFNTNILHTDCSRIKEICIGNRKREIPDYCGNQITESLYTNDFETFADGDLISVVDPSHWIAVNGLDAQVFEGYIFPDKQLAFQTGGGVNSDVILQQDEQTSGKYRIRWDMAFYDPDQGEYRVGDYYVIDSADPNDATRRKIRVAFDGDPDDDGTGEGTVHDLVNNQQYAFTYPVNDFILWYDLTFENALDFDLDNDELEINIDGNVIQVPYTDNFAGIEYYAVQGQNQVASDFVVDNICYGRKSSGQGGGGGGGAPGGSNCQPSTPIACGITHAGNNYGLINHTYDYSCFPAAMYASEKVYSFEVPSGNNGGMRLNVFDISNPNLKVVIADDCDLSKAGYCYSDNSSATYRSIDLGSLSPGKYYVFIDGPLPNTYGEFKIQLSCESTDCSGAMPISCDQSVTGDNYSGTSNVSYYPACPVREAKCMTAPEKVYTFTPDKSGMYSVRMNIHGSADLDLFVLGSCDPEDCINSGIKPPGNDEVFDVGLEAGKTYYLVVDGQFDQRSSFDILIECPKETPCDLPYFDFTVSVEDSVASINVSVVSGVESIDWTLGDGASVSGTSPGEHIYQESGAYTICGTATNTCGQYKICKEVIIHIPEPQTGGGNEGQFILYTPDGDCLPELSEQRIPVYMSGRTVLSNLGVRMEAEDVGKIEIIGMETQYFLGYNIPGDGSRISIYNENSTIENYDPNTPLFELIVRTGEADRAEYQVHYLEALSGNGIIVALPPSVCLRKKTVDVIRVSGVVKNYQRGIPLEGVEFDLNGIKTYSGLNGKFEFDPQRMGVGELQSFYNEGHPRDRINVLDIKAVKHHWAEIRTLDPFRKVAADVNDDQVINALDWDILTQLVGHQIDSLPLPSIWRLYPSVFEDRVSSDHNSIGSLPDILDLTPEGSDTPIEYYAIKMGDVSDKSTRSRSAQKLELVSQIHQSKVSIYPATDVNISALQFCMELPEDIGRLEGYRLHGKFEEAFVNIRENRVFVVFAPDAVGGVDFKKEEPMISLEFADRLNQGDIFINDKVMPPISETNNERIRGVALKHLDHQVLNLKVEVYPNPFDDYFTLEVNNSGDAAIGDFTLYNLVGREVINRKIDLKNGRSVHDIHFGESLSPGMYMGILKDSGQSVEFKIVKQ